MFINRDKIIIKCRYCNSYEHNLIALKSNYNEYKHNLNQKDPCFPSCLPFI